MSRLVPVSMLAAALALAGCAAGGRLGPAPSPRPATPAPRPAPPAPAPRVVRAPPPAKCVPDTLGPPPVYPDGEAALRNAGGAADRYQLLAAGRILREQRLQKLEEVVRHCRNTGR